MKENKAFNLYVFECQLTFGTTAESAYQNLRRFFLYILAFESVGNQFQCYADLFEDKLWIR